jgi:hypothetical protein
MKTYKRLGFAVVSVVVMVMIVLFCAWLVLPVKAATSPSFAFAIADNPDIGFTSITNAYLIITDIRTGDMYDSSGAVQTTYASAAITFTADAQNTDWALCTMPGLPTGKDYAILIYENATPTLGDTIMAGPLLWDESNGLTYTDATPTEGGRVKTTRN